jgi:hypothetical protein
MSFYGPPCPFVNLEWSRATNRKTSYGSMIMEPVGGGRWERFIEFAAAPPLLIPHLGTDSLCCKVAQYLGAMYGGAIGAIFS